MSDLINQPARMPTSAEIESCLLVLTALCQTGAVVPTNDPKMSELLRLAARLVRKEKKSQQRAERQRDLELLDATRIRDRQPSVSALPRQARPASSEAALVLSKPRHCYICKQAYSSVHPFYDCLCIPCAEINVEKRNQTADLRGRIALVTGARVKIGFQIGLKLLRAGATVIATTRFPHDAARRYAAQPDADAWADRLVLYGLDLRHLPAVERFATALATRYERLDFLIHNAAQTVRRPPAFYEHLLAGECGNQTELTAREVRLLGQALPEGTVESAHAQASAVLSPSAAKPLRLAGWNWAEWSQLPLLPGDDSRVSAWFPQGELDADGQQVDRRPENSWGLPLGKVSTVELLEVQAVNSLAPFILLRSLEPLLRAGLEQDRYVVLVSAVEGQFGTRWKSGRHPHTNMAKAALNMVTRTCAEAYAADRIFLTSVDTGWVTNEAAHPSAERMQKEGFRPPLDAEDGAARVLDPIFAGVHSGLRLHGVFLKDYRPVPW